MSDINQPSFPTLFILFLCLFLSLWPFQLYFIPQILPTTLRFLTLFFWSFFFFSALLVLSTVYLYKSLPQPWYNPLWLTGLKAPTNQLNYSLKGSPGSSPWSCHGWHNSTSWLGVGRDPYQKPQRNPKECFLLGVWVFGLSQWPGQLVPVYSFLFVCLFVFLQEDDGSVF